MRRAILDFCLGARGNAADAALWADWEAQAVFHFDNLMLVLPKAVMDLGTLAAVVDGVPPFHEEGEAKVDHPWQDYGMESGHYCRAA